MVLQVVVVAAAAVVAVTLCHSHDVWRAVTNVTKVLVQLRASSLRASSFLLQQQCVGLTMIVVADGFVWGSMLLDLVQPQNAPQLEHHGFPHHHHCPSTEHDCDRFQWIDGATWTGLNCQTFWWVLDLNF